jgi:phosphoribosyl-ATP pyrophosphohydrolase/phosphoribosyl-AMP cyclohydrolase
MVSISDTELLPAIVQHARSGEVLMLGYMNKEALTATLASGYVTFYSRSRQRLTDRRLQGNCVHRDDATFR